MVNRKVSTYLLLLGALSVTPWLGCRKQGPMERAGDRADEIVDNVREGEAPLKKKGPLEKAGESLDEATGAGDDRR